MNGADLGVWDCNVQTNEFLANEYWYNMLGFQSNEVENGFDLFFEIIHPEDAEKVDQAFKSLDKAQNDKFDIVIRLKHKDGNYRFIQDRAQVIEWQGKEPIRAVGTHIDITSRYELLVESESNKLRLEAAITGAALGVWDTNLNTKTHYANDRWWQMIGYEKDEVDDLYDLFYERVHPEDAIRVNEAIDNLHIDRIDRFDLLIRIKHKDGQYRFIRDKAKAVEWDEDGKAVRLVGTHLDVTQNQELTEKLKFHEQRLESAIKGADLGVWDSNVKTGMNYTNDRWWTMFGYQPEDTKNSFDLFFEIVHPDDGKEILKKIDEMRIDGQHSFDLLVRVRHKDGHWLYIQDRGHVVEWEDGKAFRLIGTHLDVTETHELTKKLKLNEARLNSAIKGADLGVWDVNTKTGRHFANQRWYEMLGFSPDEVDDIYTFFNSRVHPDDQAKLNRAIEELTEKGKNSFELTLRVRHKNGTYRYIQDRSQAIEWENGYAIRAIGTHLDITENYELTNQLKLNESRLQAAINGADLGVWDLDLRTGINTTNDRWWEMLGYQPQECESTMDFFTSIVHPDDLEVIFKTIESLNEKSITDVDIILRMRHKEGHYIHVLDRGQVIEWEDGKVARMIGTILNISDQIQHEIDLKNSLMERESILESIDSGFIALNEDLYITYFNPTAQLMLDKADKELIGTQLFDLFDEELNKRFKQNIEKLEGQSTTQPIEFLDVNTEKWLELKLYKRQSGYGLFIQDNTQSKMFHERMLENSIRSVENERNRISKELHDGVLQEMTAAMLYTENIRHKLKDESLNENFDKLSYLVKKTANDTRKISHDLQVPELEKDKLTDLLQRLVDNVNLATSVEFHLTIFDMKEDRRLKDRIKINTFRIVQELIVNVIKHSQATEAHINLEIDLRHLTLRLIDNGIGIDNVKVTPSGIGIRNINERTSQLNGSFQMENGKEKGLVTTVIIPIV